jgi:hypothetical protein
MTKKDYVKLALKLREEVELNEKKLKEDPEETAQTYYKGKLSALDYTIKEVLIPVLKGDNPRFSEVKFIDFIYQLPALEPEFKK